VLMTELKLPLPNLDNVSIAIIGLGYVGLPLAVEFSKHCSRAGTSAGKVIGFDINQQRIEDLRSGIDRTREISQSELEEAQGLTVTSDLSMLRQCQVFVVTVPTPIDAAKRPNLEPLRKASATVGQVLKRGDVVIYESTVYPGATEEICVPILEQVSGLTFNTDFSCGYSPERVVPGDKTHRLTTIRKVTSGSTPATADFVDMLYKSIIVAGTHKAPSLKVAEAAKVIENTQRDLNIALVNELALIFSRLNIDTLDVLEAASTKWNFLPFRPGLVGGHCIGVDPCYLTHKAEEVGYYPQVVLAGRRINDGMGAWVAQQLILKMAERGLSIYSSKVLVLGLTFKENCPDLRNTRVIDVIHELNRYGIDVTVVDPWADPEEAQHDYDIRLHSGVPDNESYSAVIAAVAHKEFQRLSEDDWQRLLSERGVLFDLKGQVPRHLATLRM
jgi:UDP-N-acetyl-D-glucosamine/UDP-N-acetyl-D-galactosamine dehydrogenase